MTAAKPLVTVAMPVHNGARFLQAALDSALNQTHRQLEILVYDDGSTDDSVAMARSCADDRVKVIGAAENAGVGVARQHLKTAAKGDYLIWLDSDDLFEPRRVEVLLQKALESGADLVIDSSLLIDEEGTTLPGLRRVPDHVACDANFTRLFERNVMNPHPLVSRACFERIDFDPELKVSEDYDFWLGASAAGFGFQRVDETLHRYRLTGNSLSCRPEPARRAVRRIFAKYEVEDLKDLYRRRGFAPENVQGMACLQHIFRREYPEALACTLGPWPDETLSDRDFYRGTLELECGDEAVGEEHLRRHLQRWPDSPAGLNNLGVFIRRTGNMSSELWTQALDLFPGYRDALANEAGIETLTMTQLAPRRLR